MAKRGESPAFSSTARRHVPVNSVYHYSAQHESAPEPSPVEKDARDSVEKRETGKQSAAFSYRRDCREWLRRVRSVAEDALYGLIDAGFKLAAKFGRPGNEENRERERPR